MSTIRVQLKGPAGTQKSVLTDVPANLSFAAFKSLVRTKTGLVESKQSLMVGFPPQLIATSDDHTPISELKIRNGDLVLVTDVSTMERNLLDGSTMEGKGGWQYPPSIAKSGMMIRKDMPRDNSCLFHCVALLCAGRSTGSASASDMRDIISNLVASNIERYNATFLGMSNQQYQIMLRNPDFWGGAIELSIFAQNFETEIIAFDYHYLREDVFGEGSGYKRRVFIIFTGNHYDAMVYQPASSSSEVLVFSSQDTLARERARHFVETLHSAAVAEGKCTLQREWRKQLRQPEKKGPSFEGTGSSGMAAGSNTTSSIVPLAPSLPLPTSSTMVSATWSCDMCTMNNAPEADTCGICGARRATASSSTPTTGANTKSSVESKRDPAAESKLTHTTTTSTAANNSTHSNSNSNNGFGPWQCPSCSFDNPRRSLRCDACNQSNPYLPKPSTTSSPSSSTNSNNDHDIGSPNGGTSGMLAADTAWTCDACTYRNPRRSPLCGTCHTPNPTAEDSDFGSVPIATDDRFITPRSSSSPPVTNPSTSTQPARRGIMSELFGAAQAENNAHRLAHLWQCPNCHYQNTNRHVAKCRQCLSANPYWEPMPSDPGACRIA